MKIVICGTRTFSDYALLKATMDKLTKNLKEVVVISGHSGHTYYSKQGDRVVKVIVGADLLGEEWATLRRHPFEVYHPDYRKGSPKLAPLLRNEEMAKVADAVVAFWNGESGGTEDMIARARRHKLKLKVIHYKE